MTQFQKNTQTDGRTDKPYFIGHFWLLLGVQKAGQKLSALLRISPYLKIHRQKQYTTQ